MPEAKVDDTEGQVNQHEWGGPSPVLLDHASRPRNVGELPQADGVGTYTHACGDSITVYIKVRNKIIEQIRYIPQSCAWTLACISMASTMAEGLHPIEAQRRVRAEAIAEALGGLPRQEFHSAEIAARAISAAVVDWMSSEREPWRRLYR